MKKNLNACSMIAFSFVMLATQPVFGKCVTNHVKGTTFSNCNEEATASRHKAKGVFKASDDDNAPGHPQSNDGALSLQSGPGSSDMPPGSVDGVKLHNFKGSVSGPAANPKGWKEKKQ